jgi:hypothetical protein
MDSRGIHHKFRNSLFGRLLAGGACGATALTVVLAAGCGSHTQAPAASHRPAPAKALRLAAEQEQHLTSFTATLTMRLSGMRAATITGVMRARLKPEPAMYIEATLARAGHASRSMREIMARHALYLSAGQRFTQKFGKPWVKVSPGSLQQSSQMNFGSVGFFGPRLGKSGTVSLGQDVMLTAAKDVHVDGVQMVGGVQTTHYSGIYQIPLKGRGVHGMSRRLQQKLARDLGLGRMRFSAWIDGQGHVRKLSLSGNLGPSERMTATVIYTGINEPVTVSPPPPGQVTVMPPGMPGGTLS